MQDPAWRNVLAGKAIEPAQLSRCRWIGCGSGDLLLPGNRKLSDVLKQKNIQHTFSEIAGYHSTPIFRALLIDFARVLFR